MYIVLSLNKDEFHCNAPFTPRSNRFQSRSIQLFSIVYDESLVLWNNSVSASIMVVAGDFCDPEMDVEGECDAIADAEDLVPKVERTLLPLSESAW